MKTTKNLPETPSPQQIKTLAHRDTTHAFDTTMTQARSHMRPITGKLSRLAHLRPIETIGELIARTIARPNALFYGAIVALGVSCTTYAVAKYYGYQLSGSETLVGFGIGWMVGCIIDYWQLLIHGGRRR